MRRNDALLQGLAVGERQMFKSRTRAAAAPRLAKGATRQRALDTALALFRRQGFVRLRIRVPSST